MTSRVVLRVACGGEIHRVSVYRGRRGDGSRTLHEHDEEVEAILRALGGAAPGCLLVAELLDRLAGVVDDPLERARWVRYGVTDAAEVREWRCLGMDSVAMIRARRGLRIDRGWTGWASIGARTVGDVERWWSIGVRVPAAARTWIALPGVVSFEEVVAWRRLGISVGEARDLNETCRLPAQVRAIRAACEALPPKVLFDGRPEQAWALPGGGRIERYGYRAGRTCRLESATHVCDVEISAGGNEVFRSYGFFETVGDVAGHPSTGEPAEARLAERAVA